MNPSDFNTSKRWLGSIWKKYECEDLARHIVSKAQQKNVWEWFTRDGLELFWNSDEWSKWCCEWLEDFSQDGYLAKDGDRYFITDLFLGAIDQFAIYRELAQ